MDKVTESLIIEYGIMKEYDNFTLWFEPITDILDGFVLRKTEYPYSIIEIYTRSKPCNEVRFK